MTIKKETIDGVDYVRKDVLVSFFDEIYKGSIAEAVKTGKLEHYRYAGVMVVIRDLFQKL